MKHETDEEVVRRVMASRDSTKDEKEMALRIQRLIESHDAMEAFMIGVADENRRVH